MSQNDRFYIFVTVDKVTIANNRAKNWDPDSGGDKTFGSIRLSPTGQDPATHVAAATYANASMRNGIESAFSAVPWAGLYKEANGWTWEFALADMGLQRIEVVLP